METSDPMNVGQIVQRLVRAHAHELRGSLNGMTMATHNARSRIRRVVNGPLEDEARDSLEQSASKLDRVTAATTVLNDQIQALLTLFSDRRAGLAEALAGLAGLSGQLVRNARVDFELPAHIKAMHADYTAFDLSVVVAAWLTELDNHAGKSGHLPDDGVLKAEIALHERAASNTIELRLSPPDELKKGDDQRVQAVDDLRASVARGDLPGARLDLQRVLE